jgi:hypothetical protein
MTVLEFSLSFREHEALPTRIITAKEMQKEAEFLCSLSKPSQALFTHCLQRLTRMVEGKRDTLMRFKAVLKSHAIENGVFISKHICAGTGPEAAPERYEYERVMGSMPLDTAGNSHCKNFSRLPVRFAAGSSLPFLLPGHLLVSQRAEEFTPSGTTYEELFGSLKTLKLKSAIDSGKRKKKKTACTYRILVSVE